MNLHENLLVCLFLLVSSISIYSQATWELLASSEMTARERMFSFEIDGVVYVGCGRDIVTNTSEVWAYEIATNTWIQKNDFPGTARRNAVGFSIGNRGYMGTGYDGLNPLDDFWKYRPEIDSWEQLSDFPGGARGHAVSVSNTDKGYIFGGGDSETDVFFNDLWEFDVLTESWNLISNLPAEERWRAIIWLFEDNIYIGGGGRFPNLALQDLWAFDLNTQNWTEKASCPTDKATGGFAVQVHKKGYYLEGATLISNFGGDYGQGMYSYDPEFDEWEVETEFIGEGRVLGFGISTEETAILGMGRYYPSSILYNDVYLFTPENIFVVTPVEENVFACSDEDAVFELVVSENFESEVVLSFSNIPSGAGFTVSAPMANPGDTIYLTITDFNNLSLDDYSINVNATDGANIFNGSLVLSIIDTPLAANLNLPSDESMNVAQSPTFFWSTVPSASEYYFELATDDAFTNVINETTLSTTSFNMSGLDFESQYYWRVTTINDCGESVSEVYTFMTLLDLAVSINTNNITGCTSESTVFNVSIGAGFENPGATLSVSGIPTDASVTFGQNPLPAGMSTSITIDNLEPTDAGTYNLTITADDGTNNNTNNVNLILEAPPAPVSLTAPLDNAIEVSQTPQIVWSPSTGASEYTLELATDIDFNNVVEMISTNITVFSVSNELQDGTLYYWRVSAEGDCGGSLSLVRSFTTVMVDDISELINTQIDIRPNPSSGIVNILFSDVLPGNLMVEIYGINGQQLQRQIRTGEIQFEINLEDYPDGVYLLKLVNDQNALTKKIILQK